MSRGVVVTIDIFGIDAECKIVLGFDSEADVLFRIELEGKIMSGCVSEVELLPWVDAEANVIP